MPKHTYTTGDPVPLHAHRSLTGPNWRLKAAREQRGWTQQELADHLNITPNSVSRWERGISAPSPYFRRQLCELLDKSAEALGLIASKLAANRTSALQELHTAHFSALPFWNVPFQRNPFFTGREHEMHLLHQRLQSTRKGKARLLQALCGLGGIGKTQIAVEYSYRYYEAYQAVLWARADSMETLLADFVAIAALLNLPQREERNQRRVVEAVQRWFSEQPDWLLILDNLEDLALLQQVVPPIHHGHILLTMRAQTTGTLAQGIDLQKMNEQESTLFLLRRSKALPPDAEVSTAMPADYAGALEIARLLDGLPLALDQAGAYIEETACSLADYLNRYQAQRSTLLMLRGTAMADHPSSVTATLSLVIEQVEALNPMAGNLLQLCAFLQPDAIPEALIIEGSATEESILGPLAHNPYLLDTIIKTLRDFSLLQRHPESKTLSLHRLVQVVLQDRLDESGRLRWVAHAVALVSRAFPNSDDDATWPRCQQYLPQALTCATLIERWQITSHEVGVFLRKVGTYLLQRNQYHQAEDLLVRAQTILQHTEREQPVDYAHCLNELALLYHHLGNYEQAEALYRQALHLREQLFGNEHMNVAETLSNLGGLYEERGQYAQAQAFFQQVQRILEKLLEPEAPLALHLLHNLGVTCWRRGDYPQAEALLRRVVALQEQLLGAGHPHTLSSWSYLAAVYAALQRYTQAEELYQEVLAQQQSQFGASHANVATSLYLMGRMYQGMGNSLQAQECYQRALTIREGVLGPEHPRTAQIVNSLAQIMLEQGQDEHAEALCQRALAIQEQTLEQTHPDYAESLATLAQLAEGREDQRKAIQLYQQVLSICEGVLEPGHPLVMQCQAAYSRLLEQGQSQSPAATGLPQPTRSEEVTQLDLATFLATRCELHPQAWCHSSTLWDAYQSWSEEHRERFPLSRRAFAEALKQRGCSPARTNEYRIWRGIALRDATEEG